MSAILKIPSVRRESASALAKLADEFNRHVGILDKHEAADAQWNSFLVERLSSLLDQNSLLEWESQSEENRVPQYSPILNPLPLPQSFKGFDHPPTLLRRALQNVQIVNRHTHYRNVTCF